MRRHLTGFTLIILTLVLSACATIEGIFAKSPVGQAVQAADFEQKLVVAAARQVKSLCTAQPPKLTTAECTKAKADYESWRAAQTVVANSIATWKSVSLAGASTTELNKADAQVRAALSELAPLTAAALDFFKKFVDVEKIGRQIAPIPAAAPTTSAPPTWRLVNLEMEVTT